MATIGLIAAMPQEREALLRRLGSYKRLRLGAMPGFRFDLAGDECLLVESGIGLKRAERAARAILAETRPQLLVTFGIAGAVQADLGIGDVVIALRSSLLEPGGLGPFQSLTSLPADAWQAVAVALDKRGARLFQGTAITTRGSQAVELGSNHVIHPILEMETAAVARVGVENGVAVLALRAISDGPRAPLPFDLAAITDDEYHLRVGELLKELLRHPRILLQAGAITRNVRTAADNAAIALVAALSQTSGPVTAWNKALP